MHMTVTIELFEKVNFEGKCLITGFHGIGEVGYIAVKYLIEETRARKVGMIVSPLTPPLVSLDDAGAVQLPFEIFVHDDLPLAFLLVRFQPHHEEMREFTTVVASFVKDQGMKGLIMLGGLDIAFKPEDDEAGYRCVVTGGFPFIDNPPRIDAGLFISGGVAMMLINLQVKQVPALTLFPYADREKPDPVAATRAIELLNGIFGTTIATDKLAGQAKDLEREVTQILKQQVKEDNRNHMYM